jgi:predicted AlkP superfamily phosphohydrolase/phosphomutase
VCFPEVVGAISGETRPRVLVVGLDGATFDLIQPLLDAGKLPNMAKIASEGVQMKLRSTILPLSPPAWTSFLTGKNPGSHGIYDFAIRAKGTYDFRPTTSLDQKSRTIWDVVGSSGGISIIVNVPLTYPPTPLRGSMITGFPTPSELGDYAYPPDLLERLKERFGSINVHKPKVLYRKGREREITDETNQITKQQTEITKYLMEKSTWVLTVSVFDATDVIGHYFWAYLDPNHPKYDPKLAGPVTEMVEEVHVTLDRAIGELTSAVGADTLKIVMSDHGFGPVYYGVYVNNWLLQEKYMQFRRALAVRARYFAFRHGLNVYNLLRLARKLRLVKSIESAYSTRSLALKVLDLISLSLKDIDWSATRVYSAGNMGQLYLNLEGREPNGIVKKEEAQSLINELVAKIKTLEDPATGKAMFDAVFAGREVFSGPQSSIAPDVVFLDQQMVYAAHRMFELGSNKLVTPHPIYSGNHKMDGILLSSGKYVKKAGASLDSSPRLVDLAPTILQYLGYAIPEDMDGRVLTELFEWPEERRLVHYAKPPEESARIQQSIRKLATKRPI